MSFVGSFFYQDIAGHSVVQYSQLMCNTVKMASRCVSTDHHHALKYVFTPKEQQEHTDFALKTFF